MIDIAVSKLLLNTAGLRLTDCRSTDCLVKHDFADWTLNGRVVAVRSAGKRLHAYSALPACSRWGRHVAEPDGWVWMSTRRTVCGEVRPGDGDSMSSYCLPSQPIRCAHTWHVDARAVTAETSYLTRCIVDCRCPCQHHAHAPFAGAPPVCRSAWTLQGSTSRCDVSVEVTLVR